MRKHLITLFLGPVCMFLKYIGVVNDYMGYKLKCMFLVFFPILPLFIYLFFHIYLFVKLQHIIRCDIPVPYVETNIRSNTIILIHIHFAV